MDTEIYMNKGKDVKWLLGGKKRRVGDGPDILALFGMKANTFCATFTR